MDTAVNNKFVWKVDYELEVNNGDGDREHYGGYDATMLCGDDILDVIRELKSKWAGKTMRCELEGEKYIAHVVGIKVTAASIAEILTDFDEQIKEAEGTGL